MLRRVLPWLSVLAALMLTASALPSAPLSSAQGACRTFVETGKTVCGVFLTYWNTHGGLAQQGYPISEAASERSDTDGKVYTTQYFERAVFEQHPEFAGTPNEVLLSLLGVFRYQQKYPAGAPGQVPNTSANSRVFQATGKHVGGVFLTYWNTHGGLAQQGYPISEEFNEVSDLNGQAYKVQYFERAVFERHPEFAGTPNEVLLSQLGTFRWRDKQTPPAPVATSTPLVPPSATRPRPTNTPLATPTAVSEEPPRLTLEDFKALYDDPARRPYIIDVRGTEFYEEGHIKGAISFPEADVDARVGELPRDKLIVAYCQ